ncbi:TerB family tellurite resistance protein [Elstera litoralis]|uniref:TerB family tellurite resistance protein n=1 Tax=Elstera litoralis TaxID=552518 RepID=UPI001E626770|nr:TerB family tellurite resistance protein [Elstera litoralis]
MGGLIREYVGEAYQTLTTEKPLPPPEQAVKSIAFTIGVIALSAKMAKADGEVTPPEVTAFRKIFTVSPEEAEKRPPGFRPRAERYGGL